MLIPAKVAKSETEIANQNFNKMQETYWQEEAASFNEMIMNAAKESRSEVTTTVDKRFHEYVKQKLNENGYACTIHPSAKSDTSYKITIGW